MCCALIRYEVGKMLGMDFYPFLRNDSKHGHFCYFFRVGIHTSRVVLHRGCLGKRVLVHDQVWDQYNCLDHCQSLPVQFPNVLSTRAFDDNFDGKKMSMEGYKKKVPKSWANSFQFIRQNSVMENRDSKKIPAIG